MAKTLEISILCECCKKWFPSPIFFETSESFEPYVLFGNLARCMHCGEMTSCKEENFRARFEDGGFRGIDT